MTEWLGKSGHGMRVIFRNSAGTIVKCTYILFIGKAPQDYGAVITIYEKCLMQIKEDTPHIKFLEDNLIMLVATIMKTYFLGKHNGLKRM
jgi:hypothetical protein